MNAFEIASAGARGFCAGGEDSGDTRRSMPRFEKIVLGNGFGFSYPATRLADGSVKLDSCVTFDQFRTLAQYNLVNTSPESHAYKLTMTTIREYLERSKKIDKVTRELFTAMATGCGMKINVARANLLWIEEMREIINNEESKHE